MKILHTSDWHVGKVLKGRDRHDKHVAVLRSIVQGTSSRPRRPRAWSFRHCWHCGKTVARSSLSPGTMTTSWRYGPGAGRR